MCYNRNRHKLGVSMRKTTSILWGCVLVALGVILGINALGIARIDIFFPGWWTLFIIVPCFISLFGGDSDKTGDIIRIVIGVCLLLACQGVIAFGVLWKLLVPAILIIIGLSIIFKDALKGKVVKEVKKLHGKTNDKEYWATFSGQNLDFAKENFEGCRLEAIFGGIKCDLREAKIEQDVLVRASSVFGGITIYAPESVNVQVISTAMFGGVTNHHGKKAKDEAKKTVFVEATCIFGGVEIK